MTTQFRCFCISLSMILLPFLVVAQDGAFKVEAKKKPTSPYISYDTRIVSQLPDFKADKVIATNIYGSRLDKKTKATGFFRIEFIDGRWWIVDPEGYLNICRAVNDIKQGRGAISETASATKFGSSSTTWMTKTMEHLNEIGFYGAGSWSANDAIISNPRQKMNPMAYTIMLNWMSGYGRGRTIQLPGHMGYPNNCIFVFEKGFAEYCDDKAKALAANKNDKNLFGYFTDNELPFKDTNLTGYLALGLQEPKNENYLAAKQ